MDPPFYIIPPFLSSNVFLLGLFIPWDFLSHPFSDFSESLSHPLSKGDEAMHLLNILKII